MNVIHPLVQSLLDYSTTLFRTVVLFYGKNRKRTKNFEKFREDFSVPPRPNYRDFRCIIFGNSANWLQFHNWFRKEKKSILWNKKKRPPNGDDFSHSSYGAEMTKPISTGISNKKMKGAFPALGSEWRNPAECIVVSGVETWRNPVDRLVFISRSDGNEKKLWNVAFS